MNATNAKSSKNPSSNKDVLFQKIGNTWFIFTEQNGELIYSVMPEGMDPRTTKLELYQIIEEHMDRVGSHKSFKRDAEAV